MYRYESQQTKDELLSSLKYIFPIEKITEIDNVDAQNLLNNHADRIKGGRFLFWDDDLNGIIAIIYTTDPSPEIHRSFLIEVINKPQALDLSFGNNFCKVFNNDINLLPDQRSHLEIWISLRQTQFRRSISKFSSFSTEPMMKWLQLIENSTSLTYEGKPFSFCVLMTKQKQHIQNPLGSNFIQFSELISFEQGITSEKWIRGAISGQPIVIAGYGHKGQLFGMFPVPNKSAHSKTIISPHEELYPLINLLVDGTCLAITTEKGDIYLILSNNAIFYKTQGRWFYLNYNNLGIVLSKFLNGGISDSILRLILDLSFKRDGALVFIPDEIKNLSEIVPDFGQKEKVNNVLRNTLKDLDVKDELHRKVISTAAKVDGALIISSKGKVLDTSCMIGQPSKDKLQELQIEKLERFSGARSTAAWNASLYGTAIKISEDGPITIFRHGKLVAQVG